MFFTIYETTCLINGKKYIGKHITNDLNDDYLGSGLLLANAIRKYGKHNFERKILFIFDNEAEMNSKEIELITEEVVHSDQYYNIALGGQGGAIVLKPEHPLYEEVCRKISEAALSRSEKNSEMVKELHREKRCGMYGKRQSEKQKQLVSQALSGRVLTEEHKAKHRESLMKTLTSPGYVHPNKGRAKPKTECPHCGKYVDNGNFKRYHGDKCKGK